jgi:hypothetical protein
MLKIGRLLFVILISSCATEENSEQQDNDKLTGTWISTSINTDYDNNDIMTGAETVYSTFYFTESDTDIQLSRCEKYSSTTSLPSFLQKNNDELNFIGFAETPFSIISSTEISRIYEINHNYGKTSFNQTLTKMSSSIDLTRGYLQLNGPISASNKNHACLSQSINSDNTQNNKQNVLIPFDNDFITFSINLSQALATGTYQYDISQAGNSPALYSLDVYSNADTFWNTISSNTLSPEQATLEITTARSDFIEGDFSFIGQDGDSYTGSFNFIPY